MRTKFLFLIVIGLFFVACQDVHEKTIDINITRNTVNVDFPQISIKDSHPGINLLVGKVESAFTWFPEETVKIRRKKRETPQGKAVDYSMKWLHPDGYEIEWFICKLSKKPGFTIRSSFTNNSNDSVRLNNFILFKTPQTGLTCQGDPATWWLLPAMNYSRQANNLAEVLPSKNRLDEQNVYGIEKFKGDEQRNYDGHWRNFSDVITLYSERERNGLVMGAVGPGVSDVKFNCRVDNNNILLEILSCMNGVLVEPGESRISEEVLILAQPYKEALTNLFSWMAETHDARNYFKEPVYGWCSWYDRYTRIDEEHIVNVAQSVKDQYERTPIGVIQLDDGWQAEHGNWKANEKFPNGMSYCAKKIIEAGSIPGIWMAPIRSVEKNPEDWYQSPESMFLDPTNPEVEMFIRESINSMYEAGYRYYKFDYNTIGNYRPYNSKMTNFQIMRHLFSLYRESIGDESFLLACGAPNRPVIGLADASRIGYDALARWKSYPLADDNLPTLPTDIYDAIFTTARSSLMNNIVYYNDPDVTYLLPRAEDHIWRGPEGSFDPEKHGLHWSGLRSFHSYVGLLGGMTKISEPLYEEKYQKKNALRMLEILYPPAPDKGWSMNGDIDPFGRQFGFVAEKPWGKFASIVLWNKEDTVTNIQLDTYSLQDLGKRFHVWSFWDEKYLGICDSSFIAENISKHDCSLLRLTQISSKEDVPILVGSNLHISMGSAEIESFEADETIKIELTNAGALEGKIFIYSSEPIDVNSTVGCEAFVMPYGKRIYAVIITDRLRNEKNTILLKKVERIQAGKEILKNTDLHNRYKRSGFDYSKISTMNQKPGNYITH